MAKDENFSEKMKKLRAKKKISLEKLAKETGYSVDYLLQIENNEERAPSFSRFPRHLQLLLRISSHQKKSSEATGR